MDEYIERIVGSMLENACSFNVRRNVHNAVTDDTDENMVDYIKPKLAFMTPFKKLDLSTLDDISRKFAEIAAISSIGGTENHIRVTTDGPVYHFFNQGTLNKFYERLSRIIQAAEV